MMGDDVGLRKAGSANSTPAGIIAGSAGCGVYESTREGTSERAERVDLSALQTYGRHAFATCRNSHGLPRIVPGLQQENM